jgi:hypothetical protein
MQKSRLEFFQNTRILEICQDIPNSNRMFDTVSGLSTQYPDVRRSIRMFDIVTGCQYLDV